MSSFARKKERKKVVTTPVKKTHSAKHVLGAVLSARLFVTTVPEPFVGQIRSSAPWVAPVWPFSSYSAPEGGLPLEDTRVALNPNPSPRFPHPPPTQPRQGTMGPTSAIALLWCGLGPSLPASVAPCRFWHACWCGGIIWCVWGDVFFVY